MSAAENEAIVRRWYEEVLNTGDVERVDAVIGPMYVGHGPAGLQNVAALKQMIAAARTPYPDIRYQIDDLIAQGDTVVTRWTGSGTHRGDYTSAVMGRIAPTGKRITWTGISIVRIADGKIQEGWGNFD